MKICMYGDVHWCSTSSIVRGLGDKYSQRLDNLIKSVSWAEDLASTNNCDVVVCLGDFFDKALLDATEISALHDIKWNKLKHIFLVGNHEVGRASAEYSTAHLFNLLPDMTVISEPTRMLLDNSVCLFLPYCLEKDRKALTEQYDYIFSHNDIKGFSFVRIISDVGYEMENINAHCNNFFFNGHLHNSMYVGDKIVNVGNLTGQNFSEDATTYSHYAMILDTETHNFTVYENPHAFNFYKLGFVSSVNDLPNFKPNSVVSITVDINNNDLREYLETNPNIVCKRVLFQEMSSLTGNDYEEFKAIDYLDKFVQFVKDNMGMTDIVKQELSEVIA